MTFLPVVGRELRVASRRRGTYWNRFLSGLIAIALCAITWMYFDGATRSYERAQTLFHVIGGLTFLYAFLAGVSTTADSMSVEKREGTLGLLFLTDLKGYDVVFGKLAATSVNCVYRLLSVLPVLAIPMILGGVAVDEFSRMAIVLLSTLFFSLAIGIFTSSFSTQDRRSMLGTAIIVFGLAAIPPLIYLILQLKGIGAKWAWAFLIPSPGFAYSHISDSLYRIPSGNMRFWSSIGAINFMALFFLCCASLILPRSWQDKPAGTVRMKWQERIAFWMYGRDAAKKAFRTRLLNVNPFYWLTSRNRLKPAFVFGVLGVVGLLWLWLYVRFPYEMLDPTIYICTAIVAHLVIKLWIATEACYRFSEDRRSGAMELLLSTPFGVRELIEGQFLALKRQFGGPVAIILVLDLIMFWSGLGEKFVDTALDWMKLCVGGILVFVADLYALSWLGMWLGLTSKSAKWAAGSAVARTHLLPWGLLIVLTIMTTFIPTFGAQNSFNLFLGTWFLFRIGFDLFFIIWARNNLINEFRLVVTQRFQSRKDRAEAERKIAPAPAPAPVNA